MFGVSASDPLTLAVVAGLLALVALLASLVPAYRAARLDPLTVLRDWDLTATAPAPNWGLTPATCSRTAPLGSDPRAKKSANERTLMPLQGAISGG